MVMNTDPGSVFFWAAIDSEVYKSQNFIVFMLHLGPRT